MAPQIVFGEWISWVDYLGDGRIGPGKRKYLPYEDAKKWLKENYNINNIIEYRSIKFPSFISKKPYNVYKEWKGWEDYLGYKLKRRKKDHIYLDYESAKNWIKVNYPNMSMELYNKMCKNDQLPEFLPKKPERKYKNFKWCEFLEFNGRKKPKEFYLPFEEAKKIVLNLNIKSNTEWRKWCKNKPEELIRIPSSPDKVYSEWVNWYDWLGNSTTK